MISEDGVNYYRQNLRISYMLWRHQDYAESLIKSGTQRHYKTQSAPVIR